MCNSSAIWKLTIDPRGKTDPEADAFSFCKKRGIIGVGWGLNKVPKSKEEVRECYYETYGNRFASALNMMVNRIRIDDYVWVYGGRTYYLCRVTSDWWYRSGNEWDRHDIHNGRNAEWLEVPPHLVPGVVKRKMTMYGTGQIISDDYGWVSYSHYLFQNGDSSHRIDSTFVLKDIDNYYKNAQQASIFDVLDADDTEDLVGLYLQKTEGWKMLKSSTYKSQRDVECEFTRMLNGQPQVAVMQVKSGSSVSIHLSDYQHLAKEGIFVYLFSTANVPYIGCGVDNIICIERGILEEFAIDNLSLLPRPTLIRIDLLSRQPVAEKNHRISNAHKITTDR